MFKLTIMTGHFASEASGPQKLQKYILRDLGDIAYFIYMRCF